MEHILSGIHGYSYWPYRGNSGCMTDSRSGPGPRSLLDEYIAGILEALAMSAAIKTAGPTTTNITLQDFQKNWKKEKKATSSSI
eukprot:7741755-Ditylum_brightwellii.AAC.1